MPERISALLGGLMLFLSAAAVSAPLYPAPASPTPPAAQLRVAFSLGQNMFTPADTHIDFKVQVASTLAGLATAPADQVLFSTSPGPACSESTPVGEVRQRLGNVLDRRSAFQ